VLLLVPYPRAIVFSPMALDEFPIAMAFSPVVSALEPIAIACCPKYNKSPFSSAPFPIAAFLAECPIAMLS
jgi:hypothetical protein